MNTSKTSATTVRNLIPCAVLLFALALGSPVWAQTPHAAPLHDSTGSDATSVVINEILAHTDDVDTFELYNRSSQPVDISHWCFTDKDETPCLLTLPTGSIIDAHAFLLIPLDDDAPFRLSEFGETLTMSAATVGNVLTGYTDVARFGATPNSVSVGRVVTSDGSIHFPMLQSVTLGAHNTPAVVSPIVITEILYAPAAGKPQYIRVTNHTASTQRFHHPDEAGYPWEVDGIGALPIPDTIFLRSGQSLYVSSATPEATRAAYGLLPSTLVFGPWGGTLQATGENIALKRPDKIDEDEGMPMVTMDAVDFLAKSPWPKVAAGTPIHRMSPQIFGGEPANWVAGEVTRTYLSTIR